MNVKLELEPKTCVLRFIEILTNNIVWLLQVRIDWHQLRVNPVRLKQLVSGRSYSEATLLSWLFHSIDKYRSRFKEIYLHNIKNSIFKLIFVLRWIDTHTYNYINVNYNSTTINIFHFLYNILHKRKFWKIKFKILIRFLIHPLWIGRANWVINKSGIK